MVFFYMFTFLFLSLREVYKFSILEIPSSEQSLGVLFTQEHFRWLLLHIYLKFMVLFIKRRIAFLLCWNTVFIIYNIYWTDFLFLGRLALRIRSYSGPYSPAFGLNTERYDLWKIILNKPLTPRYSVEGPEGYSAHIILQ